jgi:hypothetical protein
MSHSLDYETSLKGLYKTFEPYPFRPGMPACTHCCVSQGDIDVLGSKPIAQLTREQINPFAAHLLTTCGEVEDFKFVLPRVFELSSQNQFDWPDQEVAFGCLSKANWLEWPPDEQRAVQGFLDAWWRSELQSDRSRVDATFAALCCTGANPTQWVITWRAVSPVSLADFINHNINDIDTGRYWHSHQSESEHPLRACLISLETKAAIEAAFHQCDQPDDQEVLSLAHQLLEQWLR